MRAQRALRARCAGSETAARRGRGAARGQGRGQGAGAAFADKAPRCGELPVVVGRSRLSKSSEATSTYVTPTLSWRATATKTWASGNARGSCTRTRRTDEVTRAATSSSLNRIVSI